MVLFMTVWPSLNLVHLNFLPGQTNVVGPGWCDISWVKDSFVDDFLFSFGQTLFRIEYSVEPHC